MIRYVDGDFFEYDADIMVNTVNCVGVMGAGVALAFKKKFPLMYEAYRIACKDGAVRPGSPYVWTREDIISRKLEIINFPTKDHWRRPSEYAYIQDGLAWLSMFLEKRPGKLVTLPALGCGNGGLDWTIVRAMIELHLKDTPAEVLVFEPSSSHATRDQVTVAGCVPAVSEKKSFDIVHASSPDLPSAVRRFLQSEIFVSPPGSPIHAEYSLICSTTPNSEEISSAISFVKKYSGPGVRFALGTSAFDMEVAQEIRGRGGKPIHVIPSGLLSAPHELKTNGLTTEPRAVLISVGDPFANYDRKLFVPSVIVRILISECALFFTGRLEWLNGYAHVLRQSGVRYFYREEPVSSPSDQDAVKRIGALPLGLLGR